MLSAFLGATFLNNGQGLFGISDAIVGFLTLMANRAQRHEILRTVVSGDAIYVVHMKELSVRPKFEYCST